MPDTCDGYDQYLIKNQQLRGPCGA